MATQADIDQTIRQIAAAEAVIISQSAKVNAEVNARVPAVLSSAQKRQFIKGIANLRNILSQLGRFIASQRVIIAGLNRRLAIQRGQLVTPADPEAFKESRIVRIEVNL